MMASGGGDDIAVIWNLEDPENTVNILEGHKDTVDNIAFNFDGKLLATGSMDGTVIIWEADTGKKKFVLDGPGAEITVNLFEFMSSNIIQSSSISIRKEMPSLQDLLIAPFGFGMLPMGLLLEL